MKDFLQQINVFAHFVSMWQDLFSDARIAGRRTGMLPAIALGFSLAIVLYNVWVVAIDPPAIKYAFPNFFMPLAALMATRYWVDSTLQLRGRKGKASIYFLG